jgi:CheY-like chemotaxis protein
MNQIKVLLVDDNPEFLEVAANFLAGLDDVHVVGLASSGREALCLVHDLAPDLVLMDLSMPEMNGLEATRRLKRLPLPPHVVIVTLYDGPESAAAAREAGADDFITKSEFGDSLLPLIHRHFPQPAIA